MGDIGFFFIGIRWLVKHKDAVSNVSLSLRGIMFKCICILFFPVSSITVNIQGAGESAVPKCIIHVRPPSVVY